MADTQSSSDAPATASDDAPAASTAAPAAQSADLPTAPRELIDALVRLDTTSETGDAPAIDLLERVTQALLDDARAQSPSTTADVLIRRFDAEDPKNANLVIHLPATASPSTERGTGSDPTASGDPTTAPTPTEATNAASASTTASPSLFVDADDPERRGVLIAGHVDCVPVTGQRWTTDPFTPTERDGRLYGRGTADMKSFLAIAVALLPRLLRAERTVPVTIAATWDEETSCDGARELVDQLENLGIRPAIAFVGEPSSMRAVSGHKSMNSLHVTFRGVAAHSSLLPRGLNAIRYAAEFIDFFHREIIDELVAHGPHDDAYPVAWSTGGVNLVSGGNAVNTVPALAELRCEFRALPQVDAEEIVQRIADRVDELDAAMKAAAPADPADAAAAKHVGAELELVNLLYGLDGTPEGPAARAAVALGAEPTADKVTYGTEAGIYDHAGIAAVVVGPGDIAQAHGPDEFIELDQLERCEEFFGRLIDTVTA